MKKQTSQLPIILAKDEATISLFREQLETLLIDVQNMVAMYQKFPFALPGSQPLNIFNNCENEATGYIKKNLPETMEVPGLSLNKNRFAQFVEIEGISDFRAARDQVNARNGQSLLSYFSCEDGQQAIINEARFQQYVDTHSIRAMTETDRQLYAAWVRMISGLTEFNDLIKRDFTFLAGLHVPKLGMYIRENKQGALVPNPELFQAISKELNKKLDN